LKIGLICRPFVFHGGVETATAGLMAELVRRGHHLDLLTTRAQVSVPGVSIRPMPVVGQPSVARLLSFAMAARRAVRTGAYDVVQSHERCVVQDIYRAGEGTHRGYLEAMGRSGARVNPYHRAVMLLEKRIFRLTAAREIVAISAQGKSEIERLYGTPPERVTLVYNGIDLNRFSPDNRAWLGREARSRFGLPENAWVVLFVGSGFERKGLGPLIEAMARLGDKRAHLLVAGKGRAQEYRAAADQLAIADRVIWAGPFPDVERLYAAADAVALPSLYEPFGNVHLEALASGVPVLSSARAGGSELIEPGRNGWVVATVTPAAIAAGLEKLREGDPVRLSEAARASAEPFTYAAQAEALERVYVRLAR
jgi:UDP-glucose:(heptosyl)LPS alpha-1,3-glucosyltransferase